MANQFTDSFMGVPRADSPLGAGDVAIRGLKDAIRGVLNREFTGFGATLDPTKQGYLRQGSSKIWVWTDANLPLVRPDGSPLTEDDVGRVVLQLAGNGRASKLFVYAKFGSDLVWVPEPEGVVGEIKMFSGSWANPNVGSFKDALITGTIPGWFVADGSTLNLPAELGGITVSLPNLTNAYAKFESAADTTPTGSHTRTAAELVNHTHNVPGQTITTNSQNPVNFTFAGEDYKSLAFSGRRTVNSNGRGESGVTSTLTIAHTHTAQVAAMESDANSGSGETMNIEPRRFVVVPIIRVY